MAHLRDIPTSYCRYGSCSKKAAVTLVSRHNGNVGDYCKVHGKRMLDELNKQENQDK